MHQELINHFVALHALNWLYRSLIYNFSQWHSQDIAVARAQREHITFVRTSTRSAEAYRGIWEHFTASQVGSEAIYRSEV